MNIFYKKMKKNLKKNKEKPSEMVYYWYESINLQKENKVSDN